MPAWLLPPQILLLAAPIAMLLAALALSAGERRAKARRAREALGSPREGVEDAAEGERVVLEGKLHVLESACARFEDGRETAAATVESRRAAVHPSARLRLQRTPARVACSLRAGALSLSCGKEDVLIDGPVEVAVGTEETEPAAPFHSLAAAVRERIEAASGGAPCELSAEDALRAPTFRSLRDGARVRVLGRLAKTSDGARTGYRERAKWTLVGSDESPVVLAYDGTPHHRGSASALLSGVKRIEKAHVWMSLALAATVLVGFVFAMGRRPYQHLRSSEESRVRLGGGQLSSLAFAESTRRMNASCAQPRPTALPAGWRCIGEAESFTMYLPEDVSCVDDHGFGCVPQGYAGAAMRIHPHFDAEEEADLATLEHHGTEVEIDGVPARVLRSHHAIKLLFEENGTGVPRRFAPKLRSPRLSFDVECDTDEACRNAWLALQTIRLW